MSLENVVSGSREVTHVTPPMRVFDFDPAPYAKEFRAKGYVHIKGGVAPEFIEMVKERLEEYQRDRSQFLSDWEFKNKKQQYLFEFPEDNRLLREGMDTIAAVTGMAPDKVTLSERHIKVYAPNAHPNPPAHKDRFASRVAVGIPLFMPAESAVVLYPDQSREINGFDSSEDWRNSFAAADLPENVLKNVAPIKLYVGVGDVVMFLGSQIYHERINGAKAVALYLKFNDMRLDPLAEDPFMAMQRKASLARLAQITDHDLLDSALEVSPRLVRVSRHYTRNDWTEILMGQVAGEKSFPLSEDDVALLKRVRRGQKVRELLADAGIPEAKASECLATIRRLGEGGSIDILG